MCMQYIIVGVLGLLCGSFINAVVHRLRTGESPFTGRSRCVRCKHVLGPLDLVPVVSFVLLSGRCRYCKKPISWQYPIVEIVTALCFVLIYWRLTQLESNIYILWLHFAAAAVFTIFLIIIFIYDLRHYVILDVVVVPAAIIAFTVNILFGAEWWRLLLGAAAVAGFFAIQYVVSNGAWIGGGDIRLGALMGFMLSSPLVFVALFMAYILGSIIGVGLIIAGKKTMGSKVPFGTFLTAATFITMLYGDALLHWYLDALYV